jgi:hypothetical protein
VTSEELALPGIDTHKPNVARVYDYMLGGKDNFAIDRQVSQLALQIAPDGPAAARANRAFMHRVVRYLSAEAGIRQFLDIGCGLPTQNNVHEVAQAVDPAARIVYVDSDPIVLAHGRALIGDTDTTRIIQADLRRPEEILEHPDVRELIDLSQPVALLLLAILHHLNDDEDPTGIAARLRDATAPGSFVAVSHFHNPGAAHLDVSKRALVIEKIFNQTLGTGRWRTQDDILAYFGDFELLEPGLVPIAEWRPDPGQQPNTQTDSYYAFVGGLARKP